MNLTTEQKKHCAAIRTAAANGEKCEWWDQVEWTENDPFLCKDKYAVEECPDRWRIAPKKVVRPWSGPDDVPGPVCWIRWGGAGNYEHLIGCVQRDGIKNCTGSSTISWSETESAEHSTDRKTWKACVIEEEQK